LKIEYLERKENPLLNRTEVTALVHHEGPTPRRSEVKARISAELDADPDLVIVDKIEQEFGRPVSRCFVKIYKDRESLEKIEPEHKIRKNMEKKPEKDEGGSE